MIPDGEKVIGTYLREHADVAALGTRIRSKRPGDDEMDASWVQIHELNALQAENDPTDHLIEFYFQFDCYAGTEGGIPEAKRIARTIREVLAGIGTAIVDVDGGVVITAARTGGQVRNPDPDLTDEDGNPRQRVLLTSSVWMHS